MMEFLLSIKLAEYIDVRSLEIAQFTLTVDYFL